MSSMREYYMQLQLRIEAIISMEEVLLKYHYDQILDIHFFIFSDTIGLS